ESIYVSQPGKGCSVMSAGLVQVQHLPLGLPMASPRQPTRPWRPSLALNEMEVENSSTAGIVLMVLAQVEYLARLCRGVSSGIYIGNQDTENRHIRNIG